LCQNCCGVGITFNCTDGIPSKQFASEYAATNACEKSQLIHTTSKIYGYAKREKISNKPLEADRFAAVQLKPLACHKIPPLFPIDQFRRLANQPLRYLVIPNFAHPPAFYNTVIAPQFGHCGIHRRDVGVFDDFQRAVLVPGRQQSIEAL
jgi:hypothetical protein